MAFRLHVWGDVACFRRPEFTRDLVSYDVITPNAARGIFETIHWTPSIRWALDSIRVLKPIKSRWKSFAGLQSHRNQELSAVPIVESAPEARRANVLVDVAYVLTARFEMTDRAGPLDSEAQHAAMFWRRARQRRYFREPYLGLRVLPAQIAALDKDGREPESAGDVRGSVDLGWMLYDSNIDEPGSMHFFRPMMIDGLIDLTDRASLVLAR
ncbi:type I-C CRISPR-associated protein Cas5c [soil metagenome]